MFVCELERLTVLQLKCAVVHVLCDNGCCYHVVPLELTATVKLVIDDPVPAHGLLCDYALADDCSIHVQFREIFFVD